MTTPEITTPREAALDLVRFHAGGDYSAERINWLKRTGVGFYGKRYAASIGGYLELGSREKASKKRYDANWVLVHHVNRQHCQAAFRLSDLVDEIVRVSEGQTMLEL